MEKSGEQTVAGGFFSNAGIETERLFVCLSGFIPIVLVVELRVTELDLHNSLFPCAKIFTCAQEELLPACVCFFC